MSRATYVTKAEFEGTILMLNKGDTIPEVAQAWRRSISTIKREQEAGTWENWEKRKLEQAERYGEKYKSDWEQQVIYPEDVVDEIPEDGYEEVPFSGEDGITGLLKQILGELKELNKRWA